MDGKGKVLLQLFIKSKLRNETKTFLEPKFFSIVKFNNLGFSSPQVTIFFIKFFSLCIVPAATSNSKSLKRKVAQKKVEKILPSGVEEFCFCSDMFERNIKMCVTIW